MLFHSPTGNLIGALLGLGMNLTLLTSCGTGDSSNSSSSSSPPTAPAGTTVRVSVSATDPDDDKLHYRWAATEGIINNDDAPTTTWVVPPGSGLQFAYVLVYDNKGGYTEKRGVVLTMAQVAGQPTTTITPPSPSTKGFVWGTLFYIGSFGRNVYLPDVTVTANGAGGSFTATTDLKGEFFIAGLTLNQSYSLQYTIPGRPSPQNFTTPASITVNSTTLPTSPSSSSYIRQQVDLTGTLFVAGSVSLTDQSYCGIRNEFFTSTSKPNLLTKPVAASAQLLSTTNNPLGSPSSPFPVNHYGDYLIVLSALSSPTQGKVQIQCEMAQVDSNIFNVPISGQVRAPSVVIPNSRPIISNIVVTSGGNNIGRPDFPEPTTLLPEMKNAPGDDAFLTYKGIDTRKGACAYYQKIGAVQGCDADGFPTGAQLTLDQWQKKFNLSPFHDGNPAESEFKAIYINKQDLNLTRDMQGIKLQDGTLAFNVCNYPGPQNVNDSVGSPQPIGDETQPDINLAIENARRGIGKIACVAMDYSVTPDLNHGDPFVKFYTFGPSGKLLLSISLDGRREKFMPGSCVACHGGDNYGGKFPDDYSQANPTGSGQANLGSYFLPFDAANFYFSTSDPTLLRNVLLAPLRRMNELLASIPGNPATKPIADDLKSLITTRWYPPGNTDNEQTFPAPSIYSNQQIPGTGTNFCTSCHSSGTPGTLIPGPYDATEIHRIAIAPACQICHTSNFLVTDPQAGGSPRITFFERPPIHYLRGSNSAPRGPHPVCGGSPDLKMNHMMPNALGSFERFWLKKGTDQPASLFSIPPPGTGQQLGACTTPSPHPGL